MPVVHQSYESIHQCANPATSRKPLWQLPLYQHSRDAVRYTPQELAEANARRDEALAIDAYLEACHSEQDAANHDQYGDMEQYDVALDTMEFCDDCGAVLEEGTIGSDNRGQPYCCQCGHAI